MVSIHALLAECDPLSIPTVRQTRCFNPRTPCGVRHKILKSDKLKQLFQSTHSLRSATAWLQWDNSQAPVSIHALLAECDRPPCRGKYRQQGFNPRTPCGVRPGPAFFPSYYLRFQSTHSLRSATDPDDMATFLREVSIHALLAECDKWAFGLISAVCCFNPRTPCGVRHVINRPLAGTVRFQSTHSLRSATLLLSFRLPKLPVSIHALLAECDCAGRI